MAQPAVLTHTTVALSVSHLSPGSKFEVIEAGQPLLAVPFWGDQTVNSMRIQDRASFKLDHATSNPIRCAASRVASCTTPPYAPGSTGCSASSTCSPTAPSVARMWLSDAAYVGFWKSHTGQKAVI